jgi:hypothetical protein
MFDVLGWTCGKRVGKVLPGLRRCWTFVCFDTLVCSSADGLDGHLGGILGVVWKAVSVVHGGICCNQVVYKVLHSKRKEAERRREEMRGEKSKHGRISG